MGSGLTFLPRVCDLGNEALEENLKTDPAHDGDADHLILERGKFWRLGVDAGIEL